MVPMAPQVTDDEDCASLEGDFPGRGREFFLRKLFRIQFNFSDINVALINFEFRPVDIQSM